MRERGSTTLLAVVLAGVAVLAAVSVGWWVGVVGLRHRAGVAADMSALAGAQAWTTGQQPCRVAGDLARENGAVLVGCEAVDDRVWTRVSVRADVAVLGQRVPVIVEREAWAGPARLAPAPAAW